MFNANMDQGIWQNLLTIKLSAVSEARASESSRGNIINHLTDHRVDAARFLCGKRGIFGCMSCLAEVAAGVRSL